MIEKKRDGTMNDEWLKSCITKVQNELLCEQSPLKPRDYTVMTLTDALILSLYFKHFPVALNWFETNHRN